MKIYLMGEQAFVDVGKNMMLCIGSKTEVDEAEPERLFQMVREAVAWSEYREIETAKGRRLN